MAITRPEPGDETRINVNVRLSPTGVTEIDQLAAAEDRSRSSMVRVLLAEAITARRKTQP
jgi:predicted transcriptional regulator